MTRKFLFAVLVVLLITNITTVTIWQWERSAAQTGDPVFPEVEVKEPVASIGNNDISYNEWMETLEKNYGKKVLKNMIDRQVVTGLAKQENITINEKIIEREMSLLFTMQGVYSEEELASVEEQWRKDIQYRLSLEALLTKDIQIDENEIRQNFEVNEENYQFVRSVQISHVVVENMETAEKVISELEGGAAFPSLAREYSLDLETRDSGGYLGFYRGESDFLQGAYHDAITNMEEHTYSAPFTTADGVVIVYLHHVLPAISISYEDARNHIKRELALEELDHIISPDLLWDQFEIDWLYGNN